MVSAADKDMHRSKRKRSTANVFVAAHTQILIGASYVERETDTQTERERERKRDTQKERERERGAGTARTRSRTRKEAATTLYSPSNVDRFVIEYTNRKPSPD